ncbi:MAG: MetS family NSS transporter small subunit [Thermoanaerobaculia bacterium]
MSVSAIVMMLVICGIIWGGFVFFLMRAVHSEGRKQASARIGE